LVPADAVQQASTRRAEALARSSPSNTSQISAVGETVPRMARSNLPPANPASTQWRAAAASRSAEPPIKTSQNRCCAPGGTVSEPPLVQQAASATRPRHQRSVMVEIVSRRPVSTGSAAGLPSAAVQNASAPETPGPVMTMSTTATGAAGASSRAAGSSIDFWHSLPHASPAPSGVAGGTNELARFSDDSRLRGDRLLRRVRGEVPGQDLDIVSSAVGELVAEELAAGFRLDRSEAESHRSQTLDSHADPGPWPPIDREHAHLWPFTRYPPSEAVEHFVGGRVIDLAAIPEAARERGEEDN